MAVFRGKGERSMRSLDGPRETAFERRGEDPPLGFPFGDRRSFLETWTGGRSRRPRHVATGAICRSIAARSRLKSAVDGDQSQAHHVRTSLLRPVARTSAPGRAGVEGSPLGR
eukprot:scaffold911_cov314-Pavlova_lutheri.AAC.13